MSSEQVFSLVTEIEKQFDSRWDGAQLDSYLDEYVAYAIEKLSAVKCKESSLVAIVLASIGVSGSLINRDISEHRTKKIIDGSVYVLVDLLAQQIACKALLADVWAIISQSTNRTQMQIVKIDSLILNVKDLISGLPKLSSLKSRHAEYGAFLSYALDKLDTGCQEFGITGSLEAQIRDLAA